MVTVKLGFIFCIGIALGFFAGTTIGVLHMVTLISNKLEEEKDYGEQDN